MAKTPIPPQPPTVSDLRRSVEEALAKGLTPEDLVLKLTLRDSARIKRSDLFADSDVAFRNGEMHVLGVRTVTGQVAESGLERAPIAAGE